MAKKNIYMIGYGIDPKTKEPVIGKQFNNWNDAKPYIEGVQGAKYKGFYTQNEADSWMALVREQIFGNNGGNPPTETITGDDGQHGNNIPAVTQLDDEFVKECEMRSMNPDKVLAALKRMYISGMAQLDLCYEQPEYTDDDLPFR